MVQGTCKENIINLFENIVCCATTFLYYKRNFYNIIKTRLVRLWCDNALGKC